MLQVKNVSKKIKGKMVLQNINLKFEEGKMYLLQGHNGCGKTMLLRLLCGLISPTMGEVCKNPEYEYGVMIENPSFIEEKSGYYNLKYLASVRNQINTEQINAMLKKFGLFSVKNQRVRKYSLGMKQRMGIIQAIMENPNIILLDEPFNALDEKNYNITLEELIKAKEDGRIVIVAAHLVQEKALEFFDEKIIMEDGSVKEIVTL